CLSGSLPGTATASSRAWGLGQYLPETARGLPACLPSGTCGADTRPPEASGPTRHPPDWPGPARKSALSRQVQIGATSDPKRSETRLTRAEPGLRRRCVAVVQPATP